MSNPSPLESIFFAALEKRSLAERAAYLDEVCAGNDELRSSVERMLAAQAEAGGFLERPAPLPGDTIERPGLEQPGTLIGPYKLIEEIGEGGMGAVWMAQQTEPVKRLVALKLIKLGMDSRQVIARFEAERQALALMDHPHIAKVLDAGTTEAGRPYFVMELVKGLPITKYCDEHRLTPRQRLELFITVCQAVQHAHQKGIIHRDLKPTNVLVALYDRKPVPKVIDFGVAKAAGPSLTDKTLVTGFGAIVGTLEYMSPEQAEINQLDIDTRSDIYSLGVLLYELLAGSPPFSRKELEQGGMLEMLRVIREQEPSKPSTKLSTAEGLPTLAANRGTEPAKLTKLMRGELDWIVMKALDKDRNRRYETANGFAMDVERYLADEPVQACPPSGWYRFRKFTRRNKTPLAAAGLLLFCIVLVGGIAGWAVRDRQARRAQLAGRINIILDEVDRLEREQRWPEARAVAERVDTALAGSEADDATRQRLSDARRDLDFVARLERTRQARFTEIAGTRNYSQTAQNYALAFREYGVDVEVLPTEEAVARLQARPAVALRVAAALDDWASVRAVVSKADAAGRKQLAIARGLDRDPLRDRLRAMWGTQVTRAALLRLAESINLTTESPTSAELLAHNLVRAGYPDAATQVLRDAQYAHPGDFWLNCLLSEHLPLVGDLAGEVRYGSIAVSLRPESPMAHNNLGCALERQGKLDEAFAECRKAIDLDPKSVAAHVNLGDVLAGKRRPDEAIASYRKAIELDPNSGVAHNNLGGVLFAQGKTDEALAEVRKAIDIDPKRAAAHLNLADALAQMRRRDEAIASYHTAIELDPNFVQAHVNLGAVLFDQGKLDEAIAHDRKAVELDPRSAIIHNNLGNALQRQGKLDEALVECRKALDLDPRCVAAHVNLGGVLRDLGKPDEAVAECRKAIELNPTFVKAHDNLGTVLIALGKLDEAIASFHTAIELDPNFVQAHVNLGAVLFDQGKLDEAIAEWRKAVELDPNQAVIHVNLGEALYKQAKLDEAVACFTKAVELDPRYAEQLNTVALNLATDPDPKRRNGRQAVAIAQLAVKASPTNGINWRILGAAHFCEASWKQAARDLQKSIELLRGGDSFDWFLLAMAHSQLGNQELARKWYAAAAVGITKYASGDTQIRSMRDEAAAMLGMTAKDPQQAPAGGDVEIWTLVLEAQPDLVEARCQRADAYATRAEWAKAAADYARAFAAQGPTDPFQWFQYAVLQLQLGDVEGYRKLCDRMRERFGSSKTMEDIALLAHTGVLAPGAFGDMSLVRQLAEQRLTLTPLPSVHHFWSIHVLGLAYYRAGQHAEAVDLLEKGLKDQADWDYNVLNWLVLALAEQRLCHADMAKEYLDKADNWIDQKIKAAPNASGRFALPNWAWRDWLLVQLLRREAGSLIEGQEKKE